MLSSWLGMILVLLAAGEYIVRLFTRRAPRSTRGYDGFVLFGMLIAGAAVSFHHAPMWRFGVALGAGVMWFVATRAELRFRGAGKPALEPKVGDPLPSFTATTTAGETVSEKDLIAKAPAMLVLYRGHW